ncbi:glutathione S-transferase, putative [Paecilomyces variotii No. 5]|uniref:glutathione transferase n=1 Tax=Byssochlamys spectabilis (strain No. 5 / NBRC 109023) TaxID=1356009 RepID=V5HWS8_BYSSN|nr:glutathione S-transferase, putative [Paecilomyces variotii No. 5]
MAATNNKGALITLYWLEQSRSQRIVWLLEELNLSYSLKTFKRGSDMLAPAELKNVHPLGKSPVISIESPATSKPLVLAESGAIVEFLCDHFGGDKLVPKKYAPGKEGQIGGESESWMRYRFYMHYAEGSLMPLMVITLLVHRIRNAPVPFFIRPIPAFVASQIESQFLTRNLQTHFSFLEDQIKTAPDGGKFLCGKELTAADILMSFPLIAAGERDVFDKDQHPELTAYINRLKDSEGYKKAVAKIEEVEGTFQASL